MADAIKLPDLRATALVVSDDESLAERFCALLVPSWTVQIIDSPSNVFALLHNNDIRLLLLDLRSGNDALLATIKELRELSDGLVIVVIGNASVRDLVGAALQAGVFASVDEDCDAVYFRHLLAHVAEWQQVQRDLNYLQDEREERDILDFCWGESREMRKVKELALQATRGRSPILISGETGSGKTALAKFIHHRSPHASKPFIKVSLAKLAADRIESVLFGHERGAYTEAVEARPGKLELAQGGTLLLCNIERLTYNLQEKLLKAIQTERVERVGGAKRIPTHVRLIATTGSDLSQLVANHTFNEELYHKLNAFPIPVPPLREHIADLEPLLEHFRAYYRDPSHTHFRLFHDDALEVLRSYPWPGNVAELEHLIARLCMSLEREVCRETDIPMEFNLSVIEARIQDNMARPKELLQACVDAFERCYLLRILEMETWNQSRTAKQLGIHRKTLEYKIKRLDLGTEIKRRKKQQARL